MGQKGATSMGTTVAAQDLRGPMIAAITHYRDDLSVDHDAITENVRYRVGRGIRCGHGVLLAAGAGGDFPMLTLEERKQVAETIVHAARGQTPVVVGAQDTGPRVSIELAHWAEEIGAAAIQLAPSFYYAPSDDDCSSSSWRCTTRPVRSASLIYNTYWEGYNMSFDQLDRLAELPRCIALKWSTDQGVGEYLRGVERYGGRLAIIDNFGLPVMNHMLGGAGFTTHLSTIWPEHDLDVWRLMEEHEYAQAQERITAVNWPWYDFRVKLSKRTGSESPVITAALEICGRTGGPSRLPSWQLDAQERAELRDLLIRIGVPSAQPDRQS